MHILVHEDIQAEGEDIQGRTLVGSQAGNQVEIRAEILIASLVKVELQVVVVGQMVGGQDNLPEDSLGSFQLYRQAVEHSPDFEGNLANRVSACATF